MLHTPTAAADDGRKTNFNDGIFKTAAVGKWGAEKVVKKGEERKMKANEGGKKKEKRKKEGDFLCPLYSKKGDGKEIQKGGISIFCSNADSSKKIHIYIYSSFFPFVARKRVFDSRFLHLKSKM